MSPKPTKPVPDVQRSGLSLSAQALEAQTALLPYALIAFAIGLPILVWVGGYAPNAPWMAQVFLTSAVAWGVFYAVVNWLKTPAAQDLNVRARVHILSGLLWAGLTAQIASFAD
ncbi:MAG TPA: hypothetical protein VIO94_07610, partial [Phenylobacterium sp.]